MNVLKLLASLVILGMIGAVAVAIMLKIVIYGIYIAVGTFVILSFIIAFAVLRLFNLRETRSGE